MSILLIGVNGFLGQSVLPLLLKQHENVITSSRSGNGADIRLDVSCREDFLNPRLDNVSAIVNCASAVPGKASDTDDMLDAFYKSNVLGAHNICQFASTKPECKQIVHCSSLSVVSKPWGRQLSETENTYPVGSHVLYSGTKLMQELIFESHCRSENCELTLLRFSSLYGSTMTERGILHRMIEQGRNEGHISIFNADSVHADFLHVSDAAEIVAEVLKTNGLGVVNAASGVETSLRELANTIAIELNVKVIEEKSTNQPKFENRADISVAKLSKHINTTAFKTLEDGIRETISQWS